MDTLEEHAIPLSDCRAQGHNNAANMAGKYKGAHAIIEEQISVAIFSPCGCCAINLWKRRYRVLTGSNHIFWHSSHNI